MHGEYKTPGGKLVRVDVEVEDGTLRDVVVSGLSERSMSVLDGLMRGRRQQDIADDLGISPSAVSQRVRAEGLAVVVAADALLRDL